MSTELLSSFERYRTDPWAFLTECVFTRDQVDQKNPVKPFPKDWEYLRLYVMIWQKYRRLAVPKSRRMFMSWCNMGLHLWAAMFFPGQDFAFVSKKEDDAGELVKRAEFIYDHIPPDKIPKALLPRKETRAKPAALIFPEIESKIQGFPMGADQLRQFTFSGILGDECAFWEDDQKFYSAAFPTIEGGGRMTLISSRHPSFFQRIVYDVMDSSHEINEEETPPKGHPLGNDSVITWLNPKNKFFIFDLHYTANPNKQGEGFKEAVKNSMPIKDWMVEYERNWEAFDGKAVFEDYAKGRHESHYPLEPHLGLPLLCGWDFGLTPACVVAQLQGSRLIVLREYVSENQGIKQFAPQVMSSLKQHYPEWRDSKRDFIHYIDPAGLAKGQIDSEKTCATEMAAQGLRNIFPGPIDWESRRKSVEHFLLGQTKEGANFQLDPKACPTLAKGFAGGYQYPEKYAKVEPGRPSPIKNKYSHPHDALQYLCGGAVRLQGSKGAIPIPTPQYSFLMGQETSNTNSDAEAGRENRREYGINSGGTYG